ncbi:oligopeptidase A, putative [Entamoeba invadens IP1]|uniref:Oligopeptidase A, putative n=1 Tax=Entamoeba invadens IP1 TaxID=370355 RepID=A0A0A1U082_ENTIV|nr:oligopeptidase A, putative [Entamoeba invadens IP1]ELP85891.1 oligopeptidase A, putative [Entamoeba invadens IP1]|eukprot:XP_004185237.1 oligopeptidase A, putative [Entamoeba invadens IP1]
MEHPFSQRTIPIDFSQLTPNHIVEDLNYTLKLTQQRIENIRSIEMTQATFLNVVEPLEMATYELEDIKMLILLILNTRGNITEYKTEYSKVLPALSTFFAGLYSDSKLLLLLEHVRDNSSTLSKEEYRLTEILIRKYVTGGSQLSTENKAKLVHEKTTLSMLMQKFGENLIKSVDDNFVAFSSEDELIGVPANNMERFKKAAQDHNMPGFVVMLDANSYSAVMNYCVVEKTRELVYRMNNKLCSYGATDNSDLLEKILEERDVISHIFNFNDFGDFIAQNRMVSSEDALKFVEQLHDKIYKDFKAQLSYLIALKRKETNDPLCVLKPWDVGYYSQKYLLQHFHYDSEEFRKYFTLSSVLEGLFKVIRNVFQIEMKECSEVRGWHEDVKYYEAYDINTKKLLGGIFYDFFPRKGKRSGACKETLFKAFVETNSNEEKIHSPIVYIITNIAPPPVGQKEAVLTLGEVKTIFHEHGHFIHTILSAKRYAAIGEDNVEFDFIEFPSKLFENFCFEETVIEMMTQPNGEKVPKNLLNRFENARNCFAAVNFMAQLKLSKMDLEIHKNYLKSGMHVDAFLEEKLEKYSIPFDVKFLSGIRKSKHLFVGECCYAASYFTYKWDEMMALDAFDLFVQNGLFNEETSAKLKKFVLEVGCMEDANTMFRNFRGREPKCDALMIKNGFTV